MVDTKRLVTPGASYRIEGNRALFIWVSFGLLSLVTMGSEIAPLGLLLPLVFVFVRLNAYRFLIFLLAGYVCFFPPGLPGSLLRSFFTADTLSIAFIFLFVLSYLRDPGRLRIPLSPTLLSLYLAVAYIVILSFRSIPSGTTKMEWILLDLKNAFYLLFVPLLLILDGRTREPKKFFYLLSAFVLFSVIHSLFVIGRFLVTQERVVTWNEIFISDSVIISALLLRFKLGIKTTWLLRISVVVSTLGLLITQTRGLWLSTIAALGIFYACDLFRGKKFRSVPIFRTVLIGATAFLAANLLFMFLAGKPLTTFVFDRFAMESFTGYVDPFSSVGYRIHESWAIWDERTLFGHGPGATVHLYFTQLGMGRFMDWWAIHSGYFDLLHKYGFVGMTIILWMFGAYFFLGWRLAGSRSRAVSAFGAVIATVILNHAIVSVTSAYFFRHGVIMWLPLFFIAERLRPRAHEGSATTGETPDAPPSTPSPEGRGAPA